MIGGGKQAMSFHQIQTPLLRFEAFKVDLTRWSGARKT